MSSKPGDVRVVTGTTPDGKKTATIEDGASRRAWSGEGATVDEAATEATRKFIGDRRAREYTTS